MTRQRRPGLPAIAGSLALHAGVAALAIFGGGLQARMRPDPQYKVYAVKLYSPPPQVEGEPAAVVPKPEIITRPAPPVPPKKEALRKADAKTTTAAPRTERPKSAPVTGRNAKPGPVGGEGLNVMMEGEEFPDPVYLENVIRQISRYFRWTGEGSLEAHVAFQIEKDGRVSGIKVLRRSGNPTFDFAAVEAVEQAGKVKAFGPLPRVWPHSVLPVSFSFLPPR